MEAAALLKKPYARVVVPEIDGSFTAEILEFPGCVASGDTPADALANVEDVALDWIAATLEQGQDIPEPLDHANYSGKLVVRMTKGLHKRAARWAEREGVSLNQFIVTSIAEQVGARARSMQAVFRPILGVQNYFLNVGIFAVPQFGASGSQQPITVASGNQVIGFPILAVQEQPHARG
jgi:predicted RNase H-like HicB family nuclease